jgi:hypothetical protein
LGKTVSLSGAAAYSLVSSGGGLIISTSLRQFLIFKDSINYTKVS